MIKISMFEMLFAVIPEVFIFVMGAYILTNTKFNIKRIVIIGLLTGIITYFVRLLPIFPGANILFSIIVGSFMLTVIGKVEVVKSVSSFLILIVIRLATEILNIIFLTKVLQLDLEVISSDPVKKIKAFIPSVIIFAVIILFIYLRKKRKRMSGCT